MPLVFVVQQHYTTPIFSPESQNIIITRKMFLAPGAFVAALPMKNICYKQSAQQHMILTVDPSMWTHS